MSSIVILGTGIGGMSAAYEIRDTLGKDHTVTVVGEGSHFNFTPSNPWVAVGWRALDDIRVDPAQGLQRGADGRPVASATVVPASRNRPRSSCAMASGSCA